MILLCLSPIGLRVVGQPTCPFCFQAVSFYSYEDFSVDPLDDSIWLGMVNRGEVNFGSDRCREVSEFLIINLFAIVHDNFVRESETTYYVLREKLLCHLRYDSGYCLCLSPLWNTRRWLRHIWGWLAPSTKGQWCLCLTTIGAMCGQLILFVGMVPHFLERFFGMLHMNAPHEVVPWWLLARRTLDV